MRGWENPTAPTAETGVDKTLEEYLTAVPDFIRWDYWQFTDDSDGLREWCRPAEVKWYAAAIQHDAKLYHNKQYADFIAWRRPFWTVHESTSLLLGKDPDLIDPEALKADEERSVFAWFYAYLRTLIGRAQNAKEIPNPIRPRILLEWADANNIRYPEDLGEVAADSSSETEDYRWLYNSTLEQNDILKEEIKSLRSDLGRLKRQQEVLPSTETQPRKSDWTRERNTLLTMILAMAVKRFGYRPGKPYQTAPRSIEDATAEVGCAVTAQTILVKLREAEKLVHEREPEEAQRDKRVPKADA